MEDIDRDNLGRYQKGRKVPNEENRKKAEAMKRYYEEHGTLARIKEKNPRIFNSWRSMLYTEKGKKAGCSEEWKDFEVFFNDVSPTYKHDLVFHRIDTSLPFSKDNFIWVTPDQAAMMNDHNIIHLNYNEECLTLKEASIKYNQPLNAIKMRYYKHRDTYSIEEIIFGRKIKRGSKTPRDVSSKSEERIKASKLISSYKCKDKKHGHEICDIDIDWMLGNIIHKPCVYCGDTHLIGCDRIDNSKGHLKTNVVPCCCSCNKARGDSFSYEEMLVLGNTIKQIKSNRI